MPPTPKGIKPLASEEVKSLKTVRKVKPERRRNEALRFTLEASPEGEWNALAVCTECRLAAPRFTACVWS